MDDHKTSLTPEERIRVAYGHYVLGVDQHALAALFAVNAGRIAECCTAIWEAASDPKRVARKGAVA